MCAMVKSVNTDKILAFIRGLAVTSGEHLGQPVTVLPWQERFIRGCFQPKKQVETAALSIARGNGKTTVVSWLASAVLFGPLNRKNAKVIVAASSFEQGGTIHKAVLDLIPDRHDKKRWSVWDSNRLRIRCLETGAELQVLSFSPGGAHGLMGATLILCDEVSQWPKAQRDKMFNALLGTLGKSPGCKLIALGTRPSDSENPYTKLIDGQADYALEFRSKAAKTWYSKSAIARANPSLSHFPSLKAAIEREKQEARGDLARLAAFRAYRLNQGTDEVEMRNALLPATTYAKYETEGQPPENSPYMMGLDLSGGHALTAVSAVFDNGFVDGFACWPAAVDLKQRGERDKVDYAAMVRQGDLLLCEGPTVQVETVIAEAIARWGNPDCIISDFYRLAELEHVAAQYGFNTDAGNLVLRRMGWGDGSEDLRMFRRAVAEKRLQFRKCALMRQSFAAARTISDASGNEKMAKENERGSRGKDDLAAAVLISVAEAQRQGSNPQTPMGSVYVPPSYGGLNVAI